MKRHGKRILSLLIAVAMVLATSVVMTVSVGAACTLPLPDYPAGAGYGNGCWNFANLVYNRYWGYSFTNSQNTADNILYSKSVPVNAANRQATAANLKKYIYDYGAPIGSVLRISTTLNYVNASSDGDLGHSMIITGYTASNVTIYHVAGGKVLLQTLTYDYIATWMYINNGTQTIGNSYIKYIKAGSFSTPSEPPSILTISGVRYPTYKTSGQSFEVFGVISSPNLIIRGEAVVSSTAGQYMFSIFTFAEDGRHTFNLHDFDQHMLFSSLPDGNYKYYIVATDSKGYTFYKEFPFTVGPGATADAYAPTMTGTHDCNNYGKWSSGTVTTSPTCTATGIKTYTCTECGATKTETVAAKGHTVVTVNGTPATCTSDGRTSGSKCSVCNAVLTAQETIAALGHSFGEWSVKKQASCTENGTESRTCASCGITEDRAIPAKGHSYISTEIPATPSSQGYTLHECKNCGDSYKDSYTDYIDPNPNSPKAVIETKNAAPGDTVTVSISLENAPALKTLAIRDIVYDASRLELVGGKWNAEGAIIADWNQADKNAVLAFGQNTDVNGIVFTLTFKVAEGAEDAEIAVSCKLTAREKPENSEETEVDVSTVSGAVKISSVNRGDVTGDGYVDSDDAIYMLRFIMIPDGYPINQNGDFNGDGIVDSDDAIYLLYHVLLPDRYLLK